MTTTGLAFDGVSKSYAGTAALDGVGFEVRKGAFHALLGGNGSGKSTLIKVLAGVVPAEPGGRIAVAGDQVTTSAASPAWTRAAGVRFVHQDLGLFESLTVAENIALGSGFATRGGCVRWGEVRARARAQLADLGLDVDPDTPLSALRPAQRTLVAIARALDPSHGEIRVLVLDEPTASLPANEVELLLRTVKQLAAAGTTILYVTHRLREVLDWADDLTVLRDGHHVVTRPVAGLTEDAVVELIVGRALDAIYPEASAAQPGDAVLEVRGLTGGPVRGVDLAVHRGEVLGVAGTVGSGRSTLLRMLFGAGPRLAGSVMLDGAPYAPGSPAAAMRGGVAYIPEDRGRDAAFPALDVATNLSAATVGRYARFGRLSRSRERADARTDVSTLAIRTASHAAPMASLSGGNQQKVVLGRWLRLRTKVLLLDEPTQGVDVGARADIYALVRRAANDGLAVVVVSSDFDELAGVADRVVVMADGRVVAEGRPPQADRDWIAHQAHAAAALGPVAVSA